MSDEPPISGVVRIMIQPRCNTWVTEGQRCIMDEGHTGPHISRYLGMAPLRRLVCGYDMDGNGTKCELDGQHAGPHSDTRACDTTTCTLPYGHLSPHSPQEVTHVICDEPYDGHACGLEKWHAGKHECGMGTPGPCSVTWGGGTPRPALLDLTSGDDHCYVKTAAIIDVRAHPVPKHSGRAMDGTTHTITVTWSAGKSECNVVLPFKDAAAWAAKLRYITNAIG